MDEHRLDHPVNVHHVIPRASTPGPPLAGLCPVQLAHAALQVRVRVIEVCNIIPAHKKTTPLCSSPGMQREYQAHAAKPSILHSTVLFVWLPAASPASEMCAVIFWELPIRCPQGPNTYSFRLQESIAHNQCMHIMIFLPGALTAGAYMRKRVTSKCSPPDCYIVKSLALGSAKAWYASDHEGTHRGPSVPLVWQCKCAASFHLNALVAL